MSLVQENIFFRRCSQNFPFEFEYFLGLCFRCIFQNINKQKKYTAQKDNFLQSSNYTIKAM